MESFWMLLRESVVVQAFIALVLVIGAVVLSVQGVEPPRWLVDALMLILGFYFGSKVRYAESRSVECK